MTKNTANVQTQKLLSTLLKRFMKILSGSAFHNTMPIGSARVADLFIYLINLLALHSGLASLRNTLQSTSTRLLIILAHCNASYYSSLFKATNIEDF